jgi:pilus assembly protein Flp/PilA
MNAFLSAVQRFARDEEGITAIEYGLIAALMAVMIGGAAATMIGDDSDDGGSGLGKLFVSITTQLGGG